MGLHGFEMKYIFNIKSTKTFKKLWKANTVFSKKARRFKSMRNIKVLNS